MTGKDALSPLIGITGARMRASRVSGFPDVLHGDSLNYYHVPYAQAISAAGGTPVELPREADPWKLVARLDAVLIAGGDDVNPRLYGKRPGIYSTPFDPDRDEFERQLIEITLKLEKPLLGICRGCQMLNVARGGTLVEHLPLGEGESHGQLDYPVYARVHGLTLAPHDDLIAAILPPDVLVNSFHHQAVYEPGDGVEAVAHAPDGVCEAIRIGPRALGVQWHPEYHLEQPDPVFLWFVAAAREAAASTAVALAL